MSQIPPTSTLQDFLQREGGFYPIDGNVGGLIDCSDAIDTCQAFCTMRESDNTRIVVDDILVPFRQRRWCGDCSEQDDDEDDEDCSEQDDDEDDESSCPACGYDLLGYSRCPHCGHKN